MELSPIAFGFLGVGVTAVFLILVWYSARYSALESEAMRPAARWTLVGCAVLFIALWCSCGIVSEPGHALRPSLANYEYAIATSYLVKTLALIGFIFILVGQRKAYLAKKR